MKGQVSIEFFLVLSVIAAFAVILYNTAISEVGKTRVLDSSITAKSSLDALANSVDFVSFGGQGAKVSRQVFFPKETACVYFDAASKTFFCRVSSSYLESAKDKVKSKPLLSGLAVNLIADPTKPCGPLQSPGWFSVTVSNDPAGVSLSCVKIP